MCHYCTLGAGQFPTRICESSNLLSLARGQTHEPRKAQVICGSPSQYSIDYDQARLESPGYLHLGGRQSFASLTTTRLGQVLERTRFRFIESFEKSSPQRSRESAA
jgi:hypothetical protein